ncbi:MAG: hydrogenase maturation protease [Planctomycetes bacterium]|nr:hydrogenase maturation protease [Planctomycetota bacterium]
MTPPRILIAGIGNIFLGDDAFGVEVAQKLLERPLPEGVHVADFGIRGFDLAQALVDGWDTVILVDATPRGGPPGTLYVLEPDPPADFDGIPAEPGLDAHSMDPDRVLRFARTLGGPLPRLVVVGCEPAPLDENDMRMGLSAPVQAAVGEALTLIESLVSELQDECLAAALPKKGDCPPATCDPRMAKAQDEGDCPLFWAKHLAAVSQETLP